MGEVDPALFARKEWLRILGQIRIQGAKDGLLRLTGKMRIRAAMKQAPTYFRATADRPCRGALLRVLPLILLISP